MGKLLSTDDSDADEIIRIITKPGNCNFVNQWADLGNDSTILRVVPTNGAEQKLVKDHCASIQQKKLPIKTINSVDEITPHGKETWKKTDPKVLKLLTH